LLIESPLVGFMEFFSTKLCLKKSLLAIDLT
jgi:hypothetical protein